MEQQFQFNNGAICFFCNKMLPSTSLSLNQLEDNSRLESITPLLECLEAKSQNFASGRSDVKVRLCKECTVNTSKLVYHHKSWSKTNNLLYESMKEGKENQTRIRDHELSIDRDSIILKVGEDIKEHVMEKLKAQYYPNIPNPTTSGITQIYSGVNKSGHELGPNTIDRSSESERDHSVGSNVSDEEHVGDSNKSEEDHILSANLSDEEHVGSAKESEENHVVGANENEANPSIPVTSGSDDMYMQVNRNNSSETIRPTKRKLRRDTSEISDSPKSLSPPVTQKVIQGQRNESNGGREKIEKGALKKANKNLKCPCGQQYTYAKAYVNHLKHCQGEIYEHFKCNFCQDSFVSKEARLAHFKGCHPFEYFSKIMLLKNTKEEFEAAVQLTIDPNLDPKTKDNMCLHCLQNFMDLDRLREHTLVKHSAIIMSKLVR